MKHCKPCITIRDIAKIIWLNMKQFKKNVTDDIKSYSRLNATVCKLDNIPPMTTEHHMKAAQRIKELYND